MRLRVLGSAAGGGFPQWNCGCPNCAAVRAGDPRYQARTQDSIAVTADGHAWHLVNASPDVLAQIAATPALHPRAPRHSPVRSVVLTNGDLDHVLGLFSLRESWPLVVYATDAVRRGLEERNAFVRTLQRTPTQLTWRRLVLDEAIPLGDEGLTIEAHAQPGKLPVHLVGVATPSPEDNVAIAIADARGKRVVYAGATSSAEVAPWMQGADAVFFDGTFWSSDELVAGGLSKARAEDMAHAPIGGASGSLARLASLDARRRVYTHVNNSNPILRDGSPEARAVLAAGWEIAHDGMEVVP